ncbi:MFS transporter [Peribacillus sp. NPDC096540]|uniref:MFS transporter n=1 Tax=Peribacillus sp. NPDC096540 TaxID=3390612 RepID=UPI003CFD6EB2
MFGLGALCFVALSITSNVAGLYVLIAIGGACTVGTQNLANPYISEFYPREARATGMGWAFGVGRIGAIIAPMLIALILSSGLDPKSAFIWFAIPSILGACALLFVQEKYGSFDKVGKEGKVEKRSFTIKTS